MLPPQLMCLYFWLPVNCWIFIHEQCPHVFALHISNLLVLQVAALGTVKITCLHAAGETVTVAEKTCTEDHLYDDGNTIMKQSEHGCRCV